MKLVKKIWNFIYWMCIIFPICFSLLLLMLPFWCLLRISLDVGKMFKRSFSNISDAANEKK